MCVNVCLFMWEQLVEDLQSSIPSQFVQSIFSLESPVLMLRYMASEKVREIAINSRMYFALGCCGVWLFLLFYLFYI